MATPLTVNLVEAAVVLSIGRSMPADQRFELFRSRVAACSDVLNQPAVNGEYLEARGWQRWQRNSMPIWLLGSVHIMWTVDKGLIVMFPGKMVCQW